MQKKKFRNKISKRIFILLTILSLIFATGTVLAANWPDMSTGTSGGSVGGGGGGSSSVVVKAGSGTRYTLYDQRGSVIIVHEDASSRKGIIGNTSQWFIFPLAGGVKGISNPKPKVAVGEELFRALLKKANKQPSDVITTGKNTFTITAEILARYKDNRNGREYFVSYSEANSLNLNHGKLSNTLWEIACSELGHGSASDTSQGTYYLPVVYHKEVGTNKVLAKTKYNDFKADPYFNMSTSTNDVSTDYNSLISKGYYYAGVSKGSSENAKRAPDTTANSITTDENNLYVTFWYTFGKPEPPKPTTLKVMYKERGTNQTVFPTENFTITGSTTKTYKYKSGYTFVGSEKDSEGYRAGVPSQTIPSADSKDHTITFWYEEDKVVDVGPAVQQPTTYLTVRYRVRYTEEMIYPYYDEYYTVTGSKTQYYRTIPGYDFVGSDKDYTGFQYGKSSQTVYDDGDNHTITFYYEKEPEVVQPTTSLTVRYRVKDTEASIPGYSDRYYTVTGSKTEYYASIPRIYICRFINGL